jgi:hypothetical protein
MSFLSEIFGCSKCKHNKRTKKYRGGYTYKHSGSNDSGEDITASLSRSKSSSKSSSSSKGKGVARGSRSRSRSRSRSQKKRNLKY